MVATNFIQGSRASADRLNLPNISSLVMETDNLSFLLFKTQFFVQNRFFLNEKLPIRYSHLFFRLENRRRPE